MANDCGIRRLKAVMDNDGLIELGTMLVVLRVPNDYIKCIDTVWNDTKGIKVTLLDDGVTFTTGEDGATVIDSKNGNLGTGQQGKLNLNGVPANKLINVKISNKYGIVLFKIGGGNISTDEMKYFSSRFVNVDLSYAGINGNVTGNVDVFGKYTNIEVLRLQYTNITGSVAKIGNLIRLTNLNLGETSITGNWMDFVTKQVESGRSTNTNGIQVEMINYTAIRFGNAQESPNFPNEVNAFLKWDGSNKMSLGNSTIRKIYTYGYSNEEIQEYISQGYTVITAD